MCSLLGQIIQKLIAKKGLEVPKVIHKAVVKINE
jgi:hypothetical protein